MRKVLTLTALLVALTSQRVEAQPHGILQVWHGATGGSSNAKWAYNGSAEESAPTAITRYVKKRDSVCVAIPNAHPVFYSYSIAAETLSVQEQLPAAPLLLALVKAGGNVAGILSMPVRVDGENWFIKYARRLDGVATAFQHARRVAEQSDVVESVPWGRSSYLHAVDSIAKILGQIPELNGQSRTLAMQKWRDEAEKESKTDAAAQRTLSEMPVPVPTTLQTPKGEPSSSIAKTAKANQDALLKYANEVAALIETDRTGSEALFAALSGYANELLARVESFSKTWSGAGSIFTSCVQMDDAPIVIRVKSAKRDAEAATARSVGTISTVTLVPRYAEPWITLTPVFSWSLASQVESEFQVRNGVVVDVGESNALTPRTAALLSFRVHQSGDDGSVIWRLGLGSNLVKEGDPLDRLFGTFLVSYRNVLGVGVGVGRYREPRLKDPTVLGQPLPTGSTLESLLEAPKSKPGAFLLVNLSGADALSALGKILPKSP